MNPNAENSTIEMPVNNSRKNNAMRKNSRMGYMSRKNSRKNSRMGYMSRKNNATMMRKNSRKNSRMGYMSRKNNATMMRKNSRKNSRKNTRKNNMMRKNEMTRKQRGGARIAVGSRIQVMHGTADHTAGGLKKSALMMHKGRIVSRKAHAAGKKAIQRLRKAGYVAKKGQFKLFTKKH